jgi:hypothetical protein
MILINCCRCSAFDRSISTGTSFFSVRERRSMQSFDISGMTLQGTLIPTKRTFFLRQKRQIGLWSDEWTHANKSQKKKSKQVHTVSPMAYDSLQQRQTTRACNHQAFANTSVDENVVFATLGDRNTSNTAIVIFTYFSRVFSHQEGIYMHWFALPRCKPNTELRRWEPNGQYTQEFASSGIARYWIQTE